MRCQAEIYGVLSAGMNIGVLGLGRFGRFWAELLLRRAEAVYAWNRTPCEFPAGVRELSLEAYAELDVLFLCTSISSIGEVARDISPCLAPGTVVADTCSVKLQPLQELRENIPIENPILGTHPMFDPDSAVDGIENLPLVFCPERIDAQTVESITQFFSYFKPRILTMSPDEHDREAAYTQGITHFIGRVLKDLDLRPSPIATVGYTRLLQVMEQTCNDPWSLFYDLQRRNPYTAVMRDEIQVSLDKILRLLNSEVEQ